MHRRMGLEISFFLGEGRKILRILVKQNLNRKIARLLSKNCQTN